MREIHTHKVNGMNEAIGITVMDDPGQGNACHEYLITVPIPPKDLPDTLVDRGGYPIHFQNGAIGKVGVNGISDEALLAVVRDRLEGFQSGEYACDTNQSALDSICASMDALHSRTKERMECRVEGTHKV